MRRPAPQCTGLPKQSLAATHTKPTWRTYKVQSLRRWVRGASRSVIFRVRAHRITRKLRRLPRSAPRYEPCRVVFRSELRQARFSHWEQPSRRRSFPAALGLIPPACQDCTPEPPRAKSGCLRNPPGNVAASLPSGDSRRSLRYSRIAVHQRTRTQRPEQCGRAGPRRLCNSPGPARTRLKAPLDATGRKENSTLLGR